MAGPIHDSVHTSQYDRKMYPLRSEKIWFKPDDTRTKHKPRNHLKGQGSVQAGGDRARTYTRKVFTGIRGSSTLDTDARTSGYGDSLVFKSE